MSGSDQEQIVSYSVSAAQEAPKSTVGQVQLPCGVLHDGRLYNTAIVREIRGDEEDLLANPEIEGAKKFSLLVSRCLTELGPFRSPDAIASHFPELLVGDAVALLMAVRRVTYGPLVPYKAPCPVMTCKARKKPVYFNVDIRTFEQRTMPQPEVRTYQTELPDGRIAVWHPLRVADDELAGTARDRGALIESLSIFGRLESIDGKRPSLVDVRQLSAGARDALREDFEAHEGGLVLTVEQTCEACGAEWSTTFDPGQIGFFYPSRIPKAERPKRSG